MVAAVDTTQWIIAAGSIGSALIALALALGLKEWVFRPQVRLLVRHGSNPDENSDSASRDRGAQGHPPAEVAVVPGGLALTRCTPAEERAPQLTNLCSI